EALRRTLTDAQQCTNRTVRIIHGLVSSKCDVNLSPTGTLQLGHSNLNSKVPDDRASHQPPVTTEVPRVSLSTLVDGLDDYALVIDIEGAEAPLICEADAGIRNASQLFIELHPARYR